MSSRRVVSFATLVLLLANVLVFTSAADADCTGANRGWLTSGADRGGHPVGLFGPLGLHGEHKMLSDFSNSGVSLRVAEIVPTPDGGMEQTGSSNYNPFKVGGNGVLTAVKFYPGREYRVEVTCQSVCSFLGSVELGTREESTGIASSVDARAALQTGTLVDKAGNTAVKSYKGISNYTSAINNMAQTMATSYNFYWKAPEFTEIEYKDLSIRVTVVQDKTATCPGKFYEYPLDNLLKCGDGIKDQLEECDDGNSVNGDGCSSTCKIEVGYTCDKFQNTGTGFDTNNNPYKSSVCIKADVILEPAFVTLTEGKETTYTVKLSTSIKPGKEVFISTMAVPVDSASGGGITLSKSSLRFDSDGAQVAQPIIITAIQNNLRDHQREVKIKHVLSSTDENFASVVIPDFSVTLVDDDVASLTFDKKELTVTEGGATTDFFVSITAKPFGTVVVALVTLPSEQLIVTPAQLVFAPQDWNSTKKVSVRAVDNSVAEGKTVVRIRPQITAKSDQSYEAINVEAADGTHDVLVHVEDNDIPGLIVAPSTFAITEGETGAFYTVQLRTQMQAGTSVSIRLVNSCSDPQCGFKAVDESGSHTITFNSSDWMVEKKVFLSYAENDNVEWRVGDDKITMGKKTFTVEHEVTSLDAAYNTLDQFSAFYPYTVSVDVSDNDHPGLSHPEDITLTEGGTAYNFPMKLLSIPQKKVAVSLSLSSATTGVILNTTKVEWDPSEWDTSKVVQIRATHDDSIQLNDFTVKLNIEMTSEDLLYNGFSGGPTKEVTITVKDDDVGNLQFLIPYKSNKVTVVEGGDSASFQVYLNSKPISNVVVKLVASSQLTVSPETVTFTSANWAAYQTISVIAIDDTDVELTTHQGIVQFQIETSDPVYKLLKIPDLNVDIQENDFVEVNQAVGPWGGVLSPTYPSGAVTLNIPGGVLRKSVNVKLGETEKPLGDVLGTKESASGSQNEYRRVSGTYSFEPHGTSFELPVYITLHYSQTAFDNEHVDNTTRLVFLKKENALDKEWKVVPGGKFNDGIGTIAITSFSLYKVAVEKLSSPAAANAQGLQGQDIAKCINGFQLTTVDGSTCGFKFDDQVDITNNVQVTTVTNEDEYRLSTLVIILLAAVGLESLIIFGLIISLNTKKTFTYGGAGGGNQIIPVPDPTAGSMIPSKNIGEV